MKALREATRGFVGTSDMPANQFVAELVELYPEAKVVCVTRDPARWWTSIEKVTGALTPWWASYMMMPIPGWRWFFPILREAWMR